MIYQYIKCLLSKRKKTHVDSVLKIALSIKENMMDVVCNPFF